jgi:hypothetical protein
MSFVSTIHRTLELADGGGSNSSSMPNFREEVAYK